MAKLNQEAPTLLRHAANALERAMKAGVDGGAPTTISRADPDLEAAALAEIESARNLIKRALSN